MSYEGSKFSFSFEAKDPPGEPANQNLTEKEQGELEVIEKAEQREKEERERLLDVLNAYDLPKDFIQDVVLKVLKFHAAPDREVLGTPLEEEVYPDIVALISELRRGEPQTSVVNQSLANIRAASKQYRQFKGE